MKAWGRCMSTVASYDTEVFLQFTICPIFNSSKDDVPNSRNIPYQARFALRSETTVNLTS